MKNNELTKIFADSSYNYLETKDGKGEGRICVLIPSEAEIRVEKIVISAEKELRQLNNRFELIAIERAVRIAKDLHIKNYEILSDSRTAIGWSRLKNARWIPREKNEAGRHLERLKKSKN